MTPVSLESRCTARLVPSPTKLPASAPSESSRPSLATASESSGAGGPLPQAVLDRAAERSAAGEGPAGQHEEREGEPCAAGRGAWAQCAGSAAGGKGGLCGYIYTFRP